MITPKRIIGIACAALFLFGVWLVYWDIVAFATLGLNTGEWNWTIIQSGLPSIVVGIIIVIGAGYYGVKCLFGG